VVAPAVTSDPDTPSDDDEPRPPRPRAWQPLLIRSLAAIGAGVLLYLAGPPRPTWFLAPIGIAVVGLTLHGLTKARSGFWYAFLAGLGYNVPLLAWTGVFVGPVAWLPLSAAEAAFMGLVGAAIVITGRLPAAPVIAALLWVVGEWQREIFPFGGFPWAKIAFGQPEGIYLPLAAIGGTPLIGFAVALSGFGAAALIRQRVTNRRQFIAPAIATVLPIVAAFAAIPLVSTDPTAGEVTVAAIQGNVPRAGLDFNAQRRAVLDNHVRRTEQLAEEVRAGKAPKPDIVIWPENSSDIDPIRNADAKSIIDRAAKDIGVPIVVGGVLQDDKGAHNTMILWDPTKGPIDFYNKRQLQPFGETMPYRSLFRIFTKEVDRAGNFVPGDQPTVFHIGAANIALATCYEVAFDGRVRDSVRNGSNLLAVPTNNATFGYTEMTYQQLAMDRVRAVEHGRSVIVAATSGVSAIVRPDGSVSQRTSMFTPAALVERVPLRADATLSDRLGALPEWVMVIAGLAALVFAIATRTLRRENQSGTGAPESATKEENE
jgi:apolipoprotein N-acyltransferase